MENKSKLKSLKKKILSNNVFVYFLVLILLAIFVLINTAIHVSNIKDIDITENKIYTLSDASKDAIKNIDTQINIVTYGFDERSPTRMVGGLSNNIACR